MTETQIGPRIMTLEQQRSAVGYVRAVVGAIEANGLAADVLECLLRDGRELLHALGAGSSDDRDNPQRTMIAFPRRDILIARADGCDYISAADLDAFLRDVVTDNPAAKQTLALLRQTLRDA